MITIKERSREFTKVEEYLMTTAPSIESMKNLEDGTKITVAGILLFDDLKEATGEVSEILSVITPDKKVYSCQSATFKRSLKDIVTIMGGEQFTVIKTSGETKAGRKFINCVLDVSAL